MSFSAISKSKVHSRKSKAESEDVRFEGSEKIAYCEPDYTGREERDQS